MSFIRCLIVVVFLFLAGCTLAELKDFTRDVATGAATAAADAAVSHVKEGKGSDWMDVLIAALIGGGAAGGGWMLSKRKNANS